MSLDAIGNLVMYLMLYFTVIHLLNGSLTGGLVRNYTIVCLISVILRLIIYRSGYFLCFSRGAEMCSGLRLDLANHYRSLSLGYFNQNSSGYLLSTLTKDLSNFELVSTASLDADNEAKINQALDRLMKGKTVFVIAHRLNTIQNADQIIVLNQGRIEETGTHEELLRKKGHYYEMVQEQQKAREWIVKGA